ncbi:MAG: phenylalanine--tRNA ligase subunit beta [Oscillospiraceae bacterium]|nr:phenylalanine--tRNA ligase subunit beta [Oscillospiraceae bacterium]
MNLPMKWLNDYTTIDVPSREFSHRMTMTGSKVEGWTSEADAVKNVVTARVVSMERHPDSDHLWVCQTDAGAAGAPQIVTGAQNVSVGDIVPLALDGSMLPGGKEIRAGKLRGVESSGMLCSLGELGLTVHDFPDCIENGIMILPGDTPVGEDITRILGLDDVVFEFEITSNRPDCMCVTGLAREAAATFGTQLIIPQPKVTKTHGDVAKMLSVENRTPDNCLRYTGAVVENVRVKPSPQWMRERLRAMGVRPINNIVDITNYVMLEYNQPMHAFDYRNVKDHHIIVRQAQQGESIVTLDEAERRLTPAMTVIADSEKPIAVAGVMGGEYSGIADDTTTIVFESACFNGLNVRATARALGLRTEASARYEKGLDPHNTLPALTRALELIELLDAGDIVGGFIDAVGAMRNAPVIPLQPERVNAFLGTDIPAADMAAYLRKIEFKVDDSLNVTPPTYRADIEGFADVAEEVARFYGYDKIPSTVMKSVACARPTERQRFERGVVELCVASGLYEINTYSFMSPKQLDMIRVPKDSALRRTVVISNPFGEDTSCMRTTAVPSMLDTLTRNYNARVPAAAMFELAVEFLPDADPEKLPREPRKLLIGSYAKLDFYAVKGILEALAARFNLPALRFAAEKNDPTYHPGRCAAVYAGDTRLGVLGELHPLVTDNYGIRERVVIADISLDALFDLRGGTKRYRQLPKFPAITRDLALVCDAATESAAIEQKIREGCGDLLESVRVFDVYTGEKVAAGKKSIAYSLTLRDREKTLTDGHADEAIRRTLALLAGDGVTLRS